jgi:hypothetical protein
MRGNIWIFDGGVRQELMIDIRSLKEALGLPINFNLAGMSNFKETIINRPANIEEDHDHID